MIRFMLAFLLLPKLLFGATLAVSDYGDHSGIDSAGVTAAIAAAKPGDTVQMSAGTVDWNSPVVINKGVTLSGVATAPLAQGPSTLSTHIKRGSGFPQSNSNPLVTISPSTDVPVTVSGLWLDNKAQGGVSGDNKVSILVKGPDTGNILKQIRITNCFFDSGTQVDWWIGGAYGVTDHCKFLNCWIGVLLNGGNGDLGDAAWARKDYQAGNLNSVFTEDCTFIWNLTGGNGNPGSPWVTYHDKGARSVLRHCLMDSTGGNNGMTGPVDCHGNQSYWKSGSNNYRGTIRFEFYNNTVKTHGSCYQLMDLRGGSIFIHHNEFITKGDSPNLGDFRDEESDPHNTPGIPLRSPVRWPCEDQISASFIWGNTLNGSPYNKVGAGSFGNGNSSSGDPFYIKEGRDYWLKAPDSTTTTNYPAPPNGPTVDKYPSPYAFLQTTSYQEAPYPHPLAGGEAGPTPTPTVTPSPTATPNPTPTPTPPNVGDGTVLAVNPGQTKVNITRADNYSLTGLVTAVDSGNNSAWVDFDSDPTNDDGRCWDLGITAQPVQQPVTWRGNATRLAAQFNPKIWNLTTGVHTLYLIEREPLSITSITFKSAASPTPTPAPTATPTPTPKPPVQTWEKWIENLDNWIRANPPQPDQ